MRVQSRGAAVCGPRGRTIVRARAPECGACLRRRSSPREGCRADTRSVPLGLTRSQPCKGTP
eukprot:12172664-Alexandrium_andersonii.AAC.1